MTMLADRYEVKFLITSEQKQGLLEVARTALEPDPHGAGDCYRVSSQYFDSRDLRCYWEKIDGVAIRHKVRLRFYGEVDPEAGPGVRPYFLEIKHRRNETIHKERVRLTPDGAQDLLADAHGLLSLSERVAPEDREQRATIHAAEYTAATWCLQAANVISYRREAWQGIVDGRLRVTFDQCVHVHEPDAYRDVGRGSGVPLVLPHEHVMEIKFDRVIPRWIKDILVAQGLRPVRFSKYANGINALHDMPQRCRIDEFRRERMLPVADGRGETGRSLRWGG